MGNKEFNGEIRVRSVSASGGKDIRPLFIAPSPMGKVLSRGAEVFGYKLQEPKEQWLEVGVEPCDVTYRYSVDSEIPPEPEPEPEPEPGRGVLTIFYECPDASGQETYGQTTAVQGVELGSSLASNANAYEIEFDEEEEVYISIREHYGYKLVSIDGSDGRRLARRADTNMIDGYGGVSLTLKGLDSITITFKADK